MIIELFKLYNKNNAKNNIVLKFACVVSLAFAVGIIFSMQLIMHIYKENTFDSFNQMNGANIKIYDSKYLENDFSDKNIADIRDLAKKYDFSLAFCSNTNIIADQNVDSVAITVLDNDKLISSMGIDTLKAGEVAVSEKIANRFNIQVNDSIFIKLHSEKYDSAEFRVCQIIDEKPCFSAAGCEYEVAQEALGRVYIILPDFDRYNTAFVESADSGLIERLQNLLEPDFCIRTMEELSDYVSPRVNLQINVLKLSSCAAMIICSICIAWSFSIFIMDRKNDYIIFMKLGIQYEDLYKLLLIEILSMELKGVLIGLPIGSVFAYIFLPGGFGTQSLSFMQVMHVTIPIIFLVLFDTAALFLILSHKLKSITENKTNDVPKTPIKMKLIVTVLMVAATYVYVQSPIGIIFSIIIGIVFGILYLFFLSIAKITMHFLLLGKNNFFLVKEMRNKLGITILSLNVLNICMIIMAFFFSVIPDYYTNLEKDAESIEDGILYSTMLSTDKENILIQNDVTYEKYYESEIELLKVNNVNLWDCLNSGIAEEYKEDSANTIKRRLLRIYADNTHKGIEDYGIYVNNCFRNMIDFKPNDILTIRLCGNILNCKVAEVYTDVKTNDMIGFTFATCKEIDRLYIKNEDVSLKYAIAGNTSDTILAEILFEDSNAYIDKNQRLSGYLKEFIAAQKYILLNYCLIIAFSSILLVLLGQMILFIKKGNDYWSLWKIGMDKFFLIRHFLVEKTIWSLLQIITISAVLEPIKFVIISEAAVKPYALSASSIFAEFIIAILINYASIFFCICKKE
ncbi:MAG: hypothetical protein K1W35_03940 [Lachnospiraceae bacterium]